MSIANELTALSTNLSNAYDAVDNKGGTIPANKNTANLATAINSISGGGSANVENGTVVNFKAFSSTVGANNFVALDNNMSVGSTAQSSINNAWYSLAAEQLEENKFFVVFKLGNQTTLYGAICTVSGNSTTMGTAVAIASDAYGSASFYQVASVTALSADKVLVAYGSPVKLKLCSISGTTITAGNSQEIASTTGDAIKTLSLGNNKVFVAFGYGGKASGAVCTVSGDTISVGGIAPIAQSTRSTGAFGIALIDENKVFVASVGAGVSASGVSANIVTISGDSLSMGNTLVLTRGTMITAKNASIGVVPLGGGKVFVHFQEDGLACVVCNVSGTTITMGGLTKIPVNGANTSASCLLESGEVLITCGTHIADNTQGGLGCVSCKVVGSVILTGVKKTMSNTTYASYVTPVMFDLGNSKVLVIYRYTNRIGSMVATVGEMGVIPSETSVSGLTKTECTTSAAGDVWVLNA